MIYLLLCIYLINLLFNSIVTEYANHAYEIVSSLDMTKYTSILTVSGDGLLHEVVNGIMSRSDWMEVVNKISIAPLPGGSANGLSKSITHLSGEKYTIINATYLVLKGWTRRMDLMSLIQENEKPRFGFLSFSW